MNSEFYDHVSRLNWRQLSKRLTGFSIFVAKMFLGKRWNNLPKGLTHEDIVSQAITRGLNRKWDSYNESVFVKFLFYAVKSIIWNLKISGEARLVSPLVLNESSDGDINYKTPEGYFAEEEDLDNNIDYENVIKLIEEKINGDKNLENVFAGIRLGLEPREIAEETGLSPEEVYNCKKRLFTLVNTIAKSL